MNFFSSVAADLVEKRLWPVAAVLGAGAVAAPVAAHLTAPQPASSASPPVTLAGKPQASVPADTAAVKSLIAALSPSAGVIALGQGGFHDPFASGPAASSTSSPAPSSTSSGAATGGPSASRGVQVTPVSIKPPAKLNTVVSSPSRPSPARVTPPPHVNAPAPGTTPSSPTTPSSATAPATGTAPSAAPAKPHVNAPSHPGGRDALKVFNATVRFGQAASAVTYKNPVRLSPLPSSADPEVVYLGVMKGGKRAAFLVPKSATATGDGTCQPNPSHCQVVALRPGETEFLDILTATGLVQYELDLVNISHHRSATQAAAARLHRQESAGGRQILRHADATVLTELAFSPTDGTVYTRGKAVLARPSSVASTTRELPASPPAPPSTPPSRPPTPAVVPTPGTPPAAGSTPRRAA